MPLVATDAIVLHAFDYSESSRILRLATREAGVLSVLARGARRSKGRFGSAVDLFAQGAAQISVRPVRDLQTLTAFDVTSARPELASDLGRFASASVVAELALRFGTEDAGSAFFDALASALDGIAAAPADAARESGLAGAWRLVAELGFAPSLSECSACHALIDPGADLIFNHSAGGVLCVACARIYPAGRSVPAQARASIAAWAGAQRVGALDPLAGRAHQRLLREFLEHHLADGRALRAFEAWEHADWTAQ